MTELVWSLHYLAGVDIVVSQAQEMIRRLAFGHLNKSPGIGKLCYAQASFSVRRPYDVLRFRISK